MRDPDRSFEELRDLYARRWNAIDRQRRWPRRFWRLFYLVTLVPCFLVVVLAGVFGGSLQAFGFGLVLGVGWLLLWFITLLWWSATRRP